MSFNPISMDDDLTAPLDRHRNGDAFAGGSFDGHGTPSASVAGVSVIESQTPPGAFVRRCKQQYYFEFSWRVPFPQVPAAPLLYYPDEHTALLTDPAAVAVMQSELDAMSAGVLERIPLAYYPLRPETVEETRRLAVEYEQRVKDVQRKAIAAGMSECLAWRPEEVNPYLDAADAALLDTDIDLNLVLQRDNPSLTLVQRPLYTDMGLVSQEQRHQQRLARIMPDALRTQATQQTQDTAPISSTQKSGDSAAWQDGVRKSFRFARTLDSHYEKFIETIARTKLGLDTSPAALQVTRRLWRLLFSGTQPAQQRDAWHHLCLFSSTFDSASASAAEQLERDITALRLPQPSAWLDALRAYISLLRAYISRLPDGAAARRGSLRFSAKELDPLDRGAFEPDLLPGAALRRAGKELGAARQPLPIFPVAVAPLFPAAFDRAAEAAGESAGVGETAAPLRHVVLPGAVISDERRAAGPHALIDRTNLLVADAHSRRDISNGATVSYHTSQENTFEPLVSDTGHTGSYLLQHCRVADGKAPEGSANSDGMYVVYRRLGVRDVYVKAPNAEAPPFTRYVLAFDNEATPARKRAREETSLEE